MKHPCFSQYRKIQSTSYQRFFKSTIFVEETESLFIIDSKYLMDNYKIIIPSWKDRIHLLCSIYESELIESKYFPVENETLYI